MQLAKNLSEGHGYSESVKPPFVPCTIRDPGYPYLLSLLFDAFGESFRWIYVLQSFLSAITVIWLYLLAKRWLEWQYALLTAVIYCIYAPILVWTSEILTETLYTLLVVASTYCIQLILDSKRTPGLSATVAGLVFASLVLTRAEALSYLALVTLFAVVAGRAAWPLLCRLAWAWALTLLLLTPWVYRNYEATGKLMLRDPSMLYSAIRMSTGLHGYQDPLHTVAFEYPGGMPKLQAQAYRLQVMAGLRQDWSHHPVECLSNKLKQILSCWFYCTGFPTNKVSVWEAIGHRDYLNLGWRVFLTAFWGLFFFALEVYGAWSLVRVRQGSALLLVFSCYVTAVCLAIGAEYRYTIPGQALMLVFASVGIVRTMRFLPGRSSTGRGR
ncbi:MAG: glycosyltransferase family 39 protein [Acidobacteriota bacterium]